MIKSRNWEKRDWGTFTSRIRSEEFYEPDIMTEKKLDRCVQQMYKKLVEVVEWLECRTSEVRLGVRFPLRPG